MRGTGWTEGDWVRKGDWVDEGSHRLETLSVVTKDFCQNVLAEGP